MSELKDTGERLIPEGHQQTLTYGEHLSRYLTVTEIAEGKVVLDIASGAGYGTKILSKTAKKVFGIDYSPAAIEYAKQHYSAKNIEYIVGDAAKIPLPDKSVDLVVSLETIEHLEKPDKFIKEVKRILKADGQFAVSTPNDEEFIEGNEFHLHEFHLKELQRLITTNFKHSQFYYQGSFFSAALLSAETFSEGGKISGVVEKTFGQPLEKAIYFLALASDKPTRQLSQSVVVADAWSTKDDIKRDSDRRNESTSLQKEISRLREIEDSLSAQNQKLAIDSEELRRIKRSKGWRVLSKAYHAKSKLPRIKR